MEQDKEDYYKNKYFNLKNRLKKKKLDDFVQKNLFLFKDILNKDGEVLGHPDLAQRYFYVHKRGGRLIPATRLNVFIQDILMAKVLLNEEITEKDQAVRYSMAVDSLIKHLQKDRIKRPRKKEQPKKDVTPIKDLPAPAEKDPAPRDNLEAEVAKRKAQADLIKRNMELAKEKEPSEEAPKTLPGFDPAKMDKTIPR